VGGHYKGSWGFFTWLLVIGGIYFGVGTYLNIRNHGLSGAEAIPHIETIKKIPSHAGNIFGAISGKIQEIRDKRNPSGFTSSQKTAKYTIV